MKRLYCGLMIAGALAFIGCNESHQTGGGVGTPGTGGKQATFTLKGPTGSHKINHGGSQTFKVDVDKGKDFKEDVNFSAAVAPEGKGVTATVEPPVWKASGGTEETATVHVSDTAPAGDYDIHLSAKPAKGAPVSYTFKVSVPEKNEKKGK